MSQPQNVIHRPYHAPHTDGVSSTRPTNEAIVLDGAHVDGVSEDGASGGGLGDGSGGQKNVLRALLVEDNPGDARLLREYLSEGDSVRFQVETVSRLSEAMDATRARDFDVVLLDLSLPDGNGLDTFTTLAREAPDLPIVLLTGLEDDVLALRAVQAGAQDYLVKGHVSESTLPRSLLYAVERHRVQSKLKTLSIQDALTGLYNRRGFLSMAEQHLKAALRENRAMALFYADLDGMKQINDLFGHHEGDWALIKTAEILRATFRDADIIARLGGDEFTVLAWVQSEADVESVKLRLRQHVADVNDRARRPYAVRISIGAAFVAPGEMLSVNAILARADSALYEAKRNKPRSVLPLAPPST